MKYTIYSDSQYTLVGRTDDPVEALKLARTYEIRNTTDDVTIRDEETGKILDKDAEFEIFVDSLMEYPDDELLPITVEEAEIDLAEHRRFGMDVPEDLTPEIFAYVWNQMLADDAETAAADLQADLPAEPDNPMKLTKDQIITLNTMANANWERAQGMLDGMNAVLGTKYGWLGREVVWFEEPDADTARKYAAAHSAIAWAED